MKIIKLRALWISLCLCVAIQIIAQERNCVTVDVFYNHEVDKSGVLHHYTWDDTSKWGGYSEFGKMFQKYGGKLTQLDEAPTKENLRDSRVYVIVDPDNTKDNPHPNYMDAKAANAVAQWVKDGGRLLVLTNDHDNCDLVHINTLTDIFGLHFNDTSILTWSFAGKRHEEPRDYDSIAFTNLPDHPIFKDAHCLFMLGTSSITCTKGAIPLLRTITNDVVMAEARYGNGLVIAVADPWIYNEYIGHTLLPENFDNGTAADNLAKYLMQQNDREYWAGLAYSMAQPVLENMAKGELRKNMQTEFSPSFDKRDRRVLYMETFGRLMAGIAPWLSLPDDGTSESKQRHQLRQWALASYKNAVDPKNPDYLAWGCSGQNLVDAAYIAESFLRAFDALWLPLDTVTKQRYIHEFQGLRKIDPPYTNWFLFSSVIESFLAKVGAQYDMFRVNTACRKCEEWYVGDGWFSDGPVFAFNYYSSYVFHPMYLETLQAMIDAKAGSRLDYQKYYDRELRRTQKYSIILERFISPEGTFPIIGRSIPYRMAAMQPLALISWYKKLPKELSNGQVRAALTQVFHRMFDNQNNFNAGGYLTIGFCGSQPETADWYTNNGSLYMTSLCFMPLGLPVTDPFWTDKPEPWTQVKAWNGMPFPKDHHWIDTISTPDKY